MKNLTTKRRWVAAMAAAVMLIPAVTAGTLAAARTGGPDDGEAIGETPFVAQVVENIGLERSVVRDAIDRAKTELDSGAARSKSFETLVAENLGLATGEVEAAVGQAKRDTLGQRMSGKVAVEAGLDRLDRGRL